MKLMRFARRSLAVTAFTLAFLPAPHARAGDLSVDDLNVHGRLHVLTQQPCIPTTGLVLYYDFDNDSSGVAIDRSGNNNNGAVMGSPVYEPSFRGKGLTFAQNGDYVVCPSASLNANGWSELTLATWLLLKDHNTPYGWVFSKSQGSDGPGFSYGFCVGGPYGSSWNSGNFQVFTGPSSAFGLQPYTFRSNASPWPAMNVWYHVVCIYTPTSMRVYVDGALDAERSLPAPGSPIYDPPGTRLYIGDGGTEGGFHWPDVYTGAMLDEVLVYSRALSAAEVLSLYQGTVQSRVLVDAAGNVGIGTPAPSAKVHIVGNLRVDGSVGGLTAPENPADAATKQYVDTSLGTIAPIARTGSASDLSSGTVPPERLTGAYNIAVSDSAQLGNTPAAEFLKRDGSVPWIGHQNTGGKCLSGNGTDKGLYVDQNGNVYVTGGILHVAPLGNLSMGIFTSTPAP